jgi:hypothetical protein
MVIRALPPSAQVALPPDVILTTRVALLDCTRSGRILSPRGEVAQCLHPLKIDSSVRARCLPSNPRSGKKRVSVKR